MFEFFIAKKYLIPKKNQLSVSLIAVMSVMVISLVVWLVLIFLSITEGIEKTWLKKLTDLNAPLRITPTPAYYGSYYHLIDSLSLASNYTSKSLREKRFAHLTDPYDTEEDAALPEGFPKPDLTEDFQVKDLVKELYVSIGELKKEHSDLVISDFEATGVLLKLRLIRPQLSESMSSLDNQSFLTQMTYIAPLTPESSYLHNLLLKPTTDDIEHLLYLSSVSQKGLLKDEPEKIRNTPSELAQKRLSHLFRYITIDKLKTSHKHFQVPYDFINDSAKLFVSAYKQQGSISHIFIPKQAKRIKTSSSLLVDGLLEKKGGKLLFTSHDKSLQVSLENQPLYIEDEILLDADIIAASLEKARHINDIKFKVQTLVQHQKLQGITSLQNLQIAHAHFSNHIMSDDNIPPPWPYYKNDNTTQLILPSSKNKDHGLILPKNYKDSGVKIGDKGFLSYGVATASAMQEQRVPIFVAGFYDPGIMAVGARCALMHPDIIHSIASSSQSFTFDKNLSNGFQVWFKDLNQTQNIKNALEDILRKKNLSQYFTVSTFYDYDFAKDLLGQFQSDKNLFSLIGIIILIVACSNIISFLVIMVNDKKKEIGIMQSMGASKKSLALIFSSIGIILGLLGSIIGTLLAITTLHHIDSVVKFLSFIQGRDAFSSTFYGDSLPNHLSFRAALFILFTTPILSFFAGLIPAKKACQIQPAHILRSEI